MTMTRHCTRIILGGSFYGCGVAALSPGALVLEEANHPGSDFVFTFNPGTNWETEPAHPLAKEFKQQLVSGGFLRDGRLQMGVLAPLFAQWCLKQKVEMEFLSRIVALDSKRLTVLNPAGQVVFEADEILDARPKHGAKKRLTALLHHPPEASGGRRKIEDFEIIPSLFPDESYLLYDLPLETTWLEARARFHERWLKRPAALAEWRLALIGTRFDYGEFESPLAALDAGLGSVGK